MNDLTIPTEPEDSIITMSVEEGKTLEIRKDGTIYWYPNGEEKKCEDFKDLAKAFYLTIATLTPGLASAQLNDEIYDEIKHLL
jgi:hypothetical protein